MYVLCCCRHGEIKVFKSFQYVHFQQVAISKIALRIDLPLLSCDLENVTR